MKCTFALSGISQRARCTPVVAVVLLVATLPGLCALDLAPDRRALARAVGLARWPRTDADRARVHGAYVFPLRTPVVDGWSVARIEVITEFRRAALMAEDHARINDLWGRGSLADVEESLRPYHGQVRIVAHLEPRAGTAWTVTLPEADISLDDADVPVVRLERTPVSTCSDGPTNCVLIGGTIDAAFEAGAVGQRQRVAAVRWHGTDVARVSIDFAAIE